MESNAVLEVSGLRKNFSGFDSVTGVSFAVQPGEIIGLLGPNGAGKTTIISMILGVLEPTSGSIRIESLDIRKHRGAALSKTNFAAIYSQLPGNLTLWQNLKIFALMYCVRDSARCIEEVMTDMDITRFKDTKCGVLSSGEQTRTMLAKALINKPRLLLLDEPTASLDPSSARIMREKIGEFAARGGAVLWTSHNMHEVTDICDRVIFLSHGSVLLEGDPRTLPAQHGKENLEELFITVAREPLSLTE